MQIHLADHTRYKDIDIDYKASQYLQVLFAEDEVRNVAIDLLNKARRHLELDR